MKRSLIAWDENELPRATLERRVARARTVASTLARDLDALVVYTDVFRSNPARVLVNFIPYWGASLLVLPLDAEPVLLCGNSPRAYPWLRTVTHVRDLRASRDLGAALVALASERSWARIGVADLERLPYGVHRVIRKTAPELELLDLPSHRLIGTPDEVELAMRRRSAGIARREVEEALAAVSGLREHAVVARLEAALRGNGMTDTVIRVMEGGMPPRPASERIASERTSVFVAAEYRGHWVSLSRPASPAGDEARASFLEALRGGSATRQHRLDLSGDGPFAPLPADTPIEPGGLVAVHVELSRGRLYGDTCVIGALAGVQLL